MAIHSPQITMIIPQHLQAFYREISLSVERHDQDQVYEAMMQATRSSFESVRARKVCDLLVTLKKNNVATNDVEHGIRRSCCKLTCRQQLVVRMDIMRAKIKDAYKDMARKRIENARI